MSKKSLFDDDDDDNALFKSPIGKTQPKATKKPQSGSLFGDEDDDESSP
eukprot:CAMPEP_0197854534 /NCGR_PEP_ID=MMETSP1438-20131217/24848_1 /TAXON_ID=1461541 /ORGANISM="Pterosperma sp., Strain CCMP1384" /LENGTH=48 /DNA_ID= /DNA_START= /DNA_END= /DNA_ORIENTATION=